MKGKNVKFKRIISFLLAWTLVLTSVFTGFPFSALKPEKAEAATNPYFVSNDGTNAERTYLTEYTSSVVWYAGAKNPKTKPTGINWGTNLNTNIVKQGLNRVGNHTYGDTDFVNDKNSTYDCSGFAYWAIVSADSKFKPANNTIYSGYAGIPQYAEYGWSGWLSEYYKDNRFALIIGGKTVYTYMVYGNQYVPVLRCYTLTDFKKAVNDPALYGWFIISCKDDKVKGLDGKKWNTGWTYAEVMDANVLKPGMVINSAFSEESTYKKKIANKVRSLFSFNRVSFA